MANEYKVQLEFGAEASALIQALKGIVEGSEAAHKSLTGTEKAAGAMGGTGAPPLVTALAQAKAGAAGLFMEISNGTARTTADLLKTSQAAGTIAEKAAPIAPQLAQAQEKADGLTGAVVRGGLALQVMERAAHSVLDFLQKIGETGLKMQGTLRTLQFATGDGEAGMAFVRREAHDLGLELTSAAKDYAQLAAASKGTRLEGQATRDIFHAVASAATVLQLSSDDTSGSLKAINQMMSKGTVAAEELRGQLGERLPGAFNLAAKAMGVSTQQLGKMLEQGEVMAADFLPKFAAELQRSLGDEPAKAATSTQAQLNRLKTAWTELLVSVGNSGPMREAAASAGDLAAAIEHAAGNSVARELGSEIAGTLSAVKNLTLFLWEWRNALIALAKAWATIKALQIVESVLAQVAAKYEAVIAIQAEREAVIKESLALADHTRVLGQNTLAQIASAKAKVAAQIANIESMGALSGLTIAEREARIATLLHTQAKLDEAAAIAGASTASKGAGVAMGLLGGPIGTIITLIGVAVFAWSAFGKASKSAVEMASEALEKAAQNRAKFSDLVQEVTHLEGVLASSKTKTDEKKRAQEQLKVVMEQLLAVYPELNTYVKKEGETYVNALDGLKKFTEAKQNDAKASLEQAKATLQVIQAEQLRLKAEAEAETARAVDSGTDDAAAAGFAAAKVLTKEAEAKGAAAKALQGLVEKSLEELKQWQKKLAALNAPAAKPGEDPNGKTSKDLVTPAEHLVRLQQIAAQAAARTTLEEEERAKLMTVEAEIADKLVKLDDERAKGKFKRAGGEEDYKAEKEALQDLLKAREGLIKTEYADKRTALEAKMQSELTGQEASELAKRLDQIRQHFAKIREMNKSLQVDGKPFVTEASIVEAENAAILRANEEAANKRRMQEAQLQSDLTGQEEGGLEKRLDAVTRHFAKLRELNRTLAVDGKPYLTEDAILSAENAARVRARVAQVKEDLSKLKQELAELAQVKGRPLSIFEQDEVTGRYKAAGGTRKEAAGQYDAEQHRGEGGAAGFQTGVTAYVTQGKSSFDTWKEVGLTSVQSLETSFGNFFTTLTQRGQTYGQKAKALWMSVSGNAVQALSKVAGQELVLWGIQKAKLAWDAIRSAWNTKDTVKTTAESATKSAANTSQAATGFFASFAGTGPWGFALAAAAIVAMFALLNSITGRKVGGLVGKNGPELTMLGEEGLEVVAPLNDFQDWKEEERHMGANLGYNLAQHQAEIRASQAQASEYARQAQQNAGRGYSAGNASEGATPQVVFHMPGMVNLDGTRRGQQKLGGYLVDAARARVRQLGAVTRSGNTFGRL